MTRWRRLYGAGPLHPIGVLASMLVGVFAVTQFLRSDAPGKVFLWFFGAIVAHDLVFVPLYSLVPRILSRGPASATEPARFALLRLHIRIPAMLSGLLLLVFLPMILRLSSDTYSSASTLSNRPYLHRWEIATAVLFGLSAVSYLVRARRARKRRPA